LRAAPWSHRALFSARSGSSRGPVRSPKPAINRRLDRMLPRRASEHQFQKCVDGNACRAAGKMGTSR
jgi:hypothetical protein